MKAVIYNGPWDMHLVDLPIPELGAGEALLRVDTVGICGSDVHGFTGESGRRAPGMVMGHEVSGTVEHLDAGVTYPPVGSRVALYNIIADHAPSIEDGDPSFLNKQVIGVNLGKRGAMAEYLRAPAANLIPLAETVPTEIGLLAEPIGVVLHGWHRLDTYNLSPQRVLFLGAGTIGMAGVLVAQTRGIKKIVSMDTVYEKAQRAGKLGALPITISGDADINETRDEVQAALGSAPDIVIDAVGTSSSFTSATQLVSEGGTVLVIGNLAKNVALPLQDMVSNEWTLIGTYAFDRRSFTEAVSLLDQMHQELAGFIEERCSLEEVPAMMTALARGECHALKVAIDVSQK